VHRRYRPAMEAFEKRCLLSVFWGSASNGDWSTAAG
jgi:hypothetical protein